MHVIAMAGLPGVGKSALAQALARRLGCAVLDKDVVREELFPGAVDHSAGQDDRAMAAIYARVEEQARGGASHAVIDGRTFTRRAHVDELRERVSRMGATLTLIECVCDPHVARDRIRRDLEAGRHPARNRTPELHDELLRRAEPIEGPKLVVESTRGDPAVLAASLGLSP
ncbi:MAG: ATP-binding protein [Planctomycetes bacterium]|nr:ATP-binding protein [Planctomycetota bacterium]